MVYDADMYTFYTEYFTIENGTETYEPFFSAICNQIRWVDSDHI